MNIKNYIAYLILLAFTYLLLLLIPITFFKNNIEISKETLAKIAPVRVRIDKDILESMLPANESNLQ